MSDVSRHILVVEDDEVLRHVAAEILVLDGYGVTLAHDGACALRQIARHGEPDAILLDLQMPRMDGPAFARVYREQGGTAPIVVCSGAADGRQQAARLGAAGVVGKPYSVSELTAAIDQVLAAAKVAA